MPVFVRKRRPVEFVPVHAPLGHETVHQSLKPGIVTTLYQVNHFMHEHIFQTERRFFDKFEIQPDASRVDIAGSPKRLHSSDTHLGSRDPDSRLPLGEKRRQLIAEFAAIPSIQHGLPHIPVGSRANA